MGEWFDTHVATFEEQRRRLFGLAYRLLGSAAEAEELVQEAFVRWHGVDPASIGSPAAWLARVVTNLCLNRLTSVRVQRERYVGPWLPEPVLTDTGTLGPLETVEQRDDVSLGMLVLLERLTPPERAVFVLREAFGHSHREIAEILEIAEARSRQLQSRALRHVAQARPRFGTDADQHRRLVERFLAATVEGDVAALEQLLADDVMAWADGGGTMTAARRPIVGRDKVARYLSGMSARAEAAQVHAEISEVNGAPAVLIRMENVLTAVMAPEVGTDLVPGDRIIAVRTVLHPAKLAFASRQLM